MSTLIPAYSTELSRPLFDAFLAEMEDSLKAHGLRPPVDVSEQGDAWILRLDLPGVSSEDVRIDLRDRILHVEGTRKAPDGSRHYCETGYGSFQRDIWIPDGAAETCPRSRLQDGVLEIRLERDSAAALPMAA